MKTPILFVLLGLLASCTSQPPVTGTITGRDGQVRIHPDGRFEIIVEPRPSK